MDFTKNMAGLECFMPYAPKGYTYVSDENSTVVGLKKTKIEPIMTLKEAINYVEKKVEEYEKIENEMYN